MDDLHTFAEWAEVLHVSVKTLGRLERRGYFKSMRMKRGVIEVRLVRSSQIQDVPLFTAGSAARFIGFSVHTLRRWLGRGSLRAWVGVGWSRLRFTLRAGTYARSQWRRR